MYLAKSKLLKPIAFRAKLDRHKALPIQPFKQAIKHAIAQLAKHQYQGISAAELIKQFTWMIDELILIAWQHHYQQFGNAQALALLAVGGYGRGELHPHSDIDLLILLPDNNYADSQELVENFIRFLWDIGLNIGHSLRSSKDCLKEARGDLTVATSLLEARHLDGQEALVSELQNKLRNERILPPNKFFTGKLEEQRLRHARYQGTVYSLEPNLKESPGGMRDLQMILWVYNRHYGVRSFKDMKAQQLINDDEYRILIRARNILWKMRLGLHLLTNRYEDRLTFDNQRELALQFGYRDSNTALAVEQLMKRFYRTAKQVMYLNEVLLFSYEVTHSKRFSLAVSRSIDTDFVLKNKMIEQRSPTLFSKKPHTMIKLFLLMQQHKITSIHPDTIRAIRSNLDKVNHAFREDTKVRQLFLQMFKHAGIGLTNALARMNAYGLLGVYLPNFGAIVGQMQHDLFHVYTVDGHTLMVIKNLTRLRKYPHEYKLPSDILYNLYKPERLFIAALFHDIAKGRGGDHSILGETDALEFCLQHGMSEYDAKFVGWLVLSHLMMSHFSQRRDISDPYVIKEFAEFVGDQEHLDNLYLLTHADIRGTSPKVWNAWKGQLLLQLYEATRNALRKDIGQPFNEQEHIAENQLATIALLQKQLGEKAVNQEQLQRFWNTLPSDYFIRNEPFYIAWHAQSLLGNNAMSLPLISVRYSERLEANMFFIFAPFTEQLLTQVTYSFDQLELNIIEARLQLSKNGLALYSFNALSPDNEYAKKNDYCRHLEQRLQTLILQMDGEQTVHRHRASRALKHFPIQPSVTFTNNHPNYTIMEVLAQDQPSLLHNVASVLREHKLILVNARIATFGERAEDILFIQKQDQTPITNTKLQKQLESKICKALKSTKHNLPVASLNAQPND